MKPMLAELADPGQVVYPTYLSPKYDGIRCVIKDGQAVTRALKPIPNDHVRENLSSAFFEGLDGELVTLDEEGNIKEFPQIASDIMSKEGTPDFLFLVFDDWRREEPYRDKLPKLEDRCFFLPDFIECVDQEVMLNRKEMEERADWYLNRGFEGVILRSFDCPYKFGRSTVREGYLLKVKPTADAEAEVIGFVEEMQNNNPLQKNELGYAKRSSAKAGKVGKGIAGAVICRGVTAFEGNEFQVNLACSKALAKKIWEQRDKYVGRLIRYQYQEKGSINAPRIAKWDGKTFRNPADMSE